MQDGEEATVIGHVRQVTAGRVLLVVDYAETRTELPDLLRAVVDDAGAALRVLLLARSAGEWWARLGAGEPAVRALIGDRDVVVALAADLNADVSDRELVEQAVPIFADALKVAAPTDVTVVPGGGHTRVLDLHAAALVAVLDSQRHGPESPVRVDISDVLAELLGHEERFWQGSADARGLLDGPQGLTVTMLRQVVAVGALLGARTQEEALGLLQRVPGVPATVKVATWLRDVYPPTSGAATVGASHAEWLGTLQPDRLAEHHVVEQLTRSEELASVCLKALDDRQTRRAVILLGRASTDSDAAGYLLDRLLPQLHRVIDDLDAPVETLIAFANAIPYPSLLPADAQVGVARRILNALPPGRDPSERATWLSWLGLALQQVGSIAVALPATQEAVTIRRELAEVDPDRYRPDLAASLSSLGARFSELGRPGEALPDTQEAVTIYRELAEVDPDRYRPDLAASLSSLGARFSELGRPGEALPPEQEVVTILRELAEADPDRYRPDLAASLFNLGARFSELGRPGEANEAWKEAIEILGL